MGERVRGQCPVCHETRDVKKDGTMRWHLGDIWARGRRQVCAGVGKSPAGTRGPAEHASPHCACGVNGAGQRYVDPICRRNAP